MSSSRSSQVLIRNHITSNTAAHCGLREDASTFQHICRCCGWFGCCGWLGYCSSSSSSFRGCGCSRLGGCGCCPGGVLGHRHSWPLARYLACRGRGSSPWQLHIREGLAVPLGVFGHVLQLGGTWAVLAVAAGPYAVLALPHPVLIALSVVPLLFACVCALRGLQIGATTSIRRTLSSSRAW